MARRLTTGFQFLGWVFAHVVVNFIHWALLLKRKSIMDYYCACLAQRKTHHGASVERKLFNSKVVILTIWTIFGGIIPVVTVTLHNIAKPQFSIYFSSLFYSDDPPMGHALQNMCVGFMVLLQCFTLLQGFFASLMSDVIPMFITSSQYAVFQSVNQGLIRLKECKDSCQALSVKGKSSTLSPMTLAIIAWIEPRLRVGILARVFIGQKGTILGGLMVHGGGGMDGWMEH
ncbi:hypothetical protein TCAL_17242 [Tigriopus californicus]|uniref:Uncharacterized protein n=1 Tax=Tigriopus californicus TaxID=6832 RepID=A0A553NZN1_TIGCA|nr:hypothetical protein TCAL_17242 [Tigriopus californicus]